MVRAAFAQKGTKAGEDVSRKGAKFAVFLTSLFAFFAPLRESFASLRLCARNILPKVSAHRI